MQFRIRKHLIWFWGGSVLLLLCTMGIFCSFPSPEPAQPALAIAGRDGWAIERGAPPLSGVPVTLTREALLQGTLMQVSAADPLPIDFPPPNVRDVRAMVGAYLPAKEGLMLHQDAIYALCTMQFEYPLEQGVSLIRGTLSSAQQEAWRREAFDRYSRVYPVAEAMSRVTEEIPGGGESEHQLGYSLDIALKSPLSLAGSDPLLHNTAGHWLHENLWRFGWIYRFSPEEKSEGSCEGIHLRYVGKAHAAAMHTLGVSLEAYLSLLRSEGTLTLLRDGIPYCYLYCFPDEQSLSLLLPKDAQWEASADNTGFSILAIAAQGAF